MSYQISCKVKEIDGKFYAYAKVTSSSHEFTVISSQQSRAGGPFIVDVRQGASIPGGSSNHVVKKIPLNDVNGSHAVIQGDIINPDCALLRVDGEFVGSTVRMSTPHSCNLQLGYFPAYPPQPGPSMCYYQISCTFRFKVNSCSASQVNGIVSIEIEADSNGSFTNTGPLTGHNGVQLRRLAVSQNGEVTRTVLLFKKNNPDPVEEGGIDAESGAG
jgi:hypothetical protein